MKEKDLNAAVAAGSIEAFAVVVCDVNGLKKINDTYSHEALMPIPVIVMTADQGAEFACLNLGAMDFIPKHYPKWETVRARVSKCIGLSEDRDINRFRTINERRG